MMKDLYIIGAGGFGREIAWLAERVNAVDPSWNIKGFIDDNASLWGTVEDGYKVLGGCEYLQAQHGAYAVCAIGSAKVRRTVVERLNDSNVQFATLIDPAVIMSQRTEIGEGTIICAGTVLTVDIKIGSHVIINMDCTIGHDAMIDDFVTLYHSVNVSGMVHIGTCVELGTGAQIIQGLNVVSNAVIGAGAVVVRDVTAIGTYGGCLQRKSNYYRSKRSWQGSR